MSTIKRDYYEVLSVQKNADGDTIKKSFRKLAMEYHPDRNHGDETAAEKFKECSEAYEVLSDEQKRQIYDRHGHAGLNQMGGGGGGFQNVDLSDLFGDILGNFFGGGGGGGGGGGRQQQRGPAGGRDIQAVIDIELREACVGLKKSITIQREEHCEPCKGSGAKPGTTPTSCKRCGGQGVVIQKQGFFQVQSTCPACGGRGQINPDPCPTCRGAGRVAGRKNLEIDIPAGVDNGDRIRYQGEGDAGAAGGRRGDLEFVIRVKEHRFYQRDGHNLVCQWPITFSQAALGGPIEIKTLTGEKVQHHLPRGTQAGEVLRLTGHGMPNRRNNSRKGDLLIQVVIDTPQNLSAEQEELFKKLAEIEKSQVGTPEKKSIFSKLKDMFAGDEK
ncbi:molecular chaperone DnaJ [soil metagenome]